MFFQFDHLWKIQVAVNLHCKKKKNIRRFYGEINGNQLSVHFRYFTGAGIWRSTEEKDLYCFWSYCPSTIQRYFRVLSAMSILISKNVLQADARKNNGK